MTKKNHKPKSVSSEKKPIDETLDKEPLSLIMLLADLVRYLGVPGSVIAFMMYVVCFWTTESQRQQVIDTYVLFKGDWGHVAFTAEIVALIVCNLLTIGYYRKIVSLNQFEIARLNQWIDRLEGVDGIQ